MEVCKAKFEATPDSESLKSPARLGNKLNMPRLKTL